MDCVAKGQHLSTLSIQQLLRCIEVHVLDTCQLLPGLRAMPWVWGTNATLGVPANGPCRQTPSHEAWRDSHLQP